MSLTAQNDEAKAKVSLIKESYERRLNHLFKCSIDSSFLIDIINIGLNDLDKFADLLYKDLKKGCKYRNICPHEAGLNDIACKSNKKANLPKGIFCHGHFAKDYILFIIALKEFLNTYQNFDEEVKINLDIASYLEQTHTNNFFRKLMQAFKASTDFSKIEDNYDKDFLDWHNKTVKNVIEELTTNQKNIKIVYPFCNPINTDIAFNLLCELFGEWDNIEKGYEHPFDKESKVSFKDKLRLLVFLITFNSLKINEESKIHLNSEKVFERNMELYLRLLFVLYGFHFFDIITNIDSGVKSGLLKCIKNDSEVYSFLSKLENIYRNSGLSETDSDFEASKILFRFIFDIEKKINWESILTNTTNTFYDKAFDYILKIKKENENNDAFQIELEEPEKIKVDENNSFGYISKERKGKKFYNLKIQSYEHYGFFLSQLFNFKSNANVQTVPFGDAPKSFYTLLIESSGLLDDIKKFIIENNNDDVLERFIDGTV